LPALQHPLPLRSITPRSCSIVTRLYSIVSPLSSIVSRLRSIGCALCSIVFPTSSFVPPGLDEDGNTKFRRHVLLADCDDGAEVATFPYASSQPTEAGHGAATAGTKPAIDSRQPLGKDLGTSGGRTA
jgi:hypothetical protein